jgi:hypothetical protein
MCDAKKGCQKPQNLAGKPEDCSPEQIAKCHGDAAQHSCKSTGCEQPDRLRGKPENCSSEQVRKCHGDAAGHPCVEK